MNLIEQLIAFIFTKLFSAGMGKVSSQYPCQEFFTVEKKGSLDDLINNVKSFGETNKWKLAEIKTRDGARIITWVEGGFGTSWSRTVGFEVRETPDKFYVWAESRYNRSQMIDRGESKRNIESLKNFFVQNFIIASSSLTWDEAAKQVPLK